MNTQNTNQKVVIYKGIEIIIERESLQDKRNGSYIFFLNGHRYHNTTIHMAKRMITRDLK